MSCLLPLDSSIHRRSSAVIFPKPRNLLATHLQRDRNSTPVILPTKLSLGNELEHDRRPAMSDVMGWMEHQSLATLGIFAAFGEHPGLPLMTTVVALVGPIGK